MTAFGTHRHRAILEGPSSGQDPDGGWVPAWSPLEPPEWECAVAPATARDLESIGAGALIAQATHIVSGRFHKQITTQTRLTVRDAAGLVHVMNAIAVQNPDLRCLETRLVCAEVVE